MDLHIFTAADGFADENYGKHKSTKPQDNEQLHNLLQYYINNCILCRRRKLVAYCSNPSNLSLDNLLLSHYATKSNSLIFSELVKNSSSVPTPKYMVDNSDSNLLPLVNYYVKPNSQCNCMELDSRKSFIPKPILAKRHLELAS